MTIVHVHGNHVASLTEGISRNVESLVGTLTSSGQSARLDAACENLEDLNQRRALLYGGWRSGILAQRALREPGVDLVHYHVSLASLAAFSALGRFRARNPLLLHAWNALHEAGPHLPGSGLHRVANGPEATRLALLGLRELAVSSQYQAQQLADLGFRGRIHIVPNGVATDTFAPANGAQRESARAHFGVRGDPVVLYYGHMSPWKGVDTLLAALPGLFATHPKAQALLSVTSYGGDSRQLAWDVARRGLANRVQVRGPSSVWTMHAAADIAVVPARAAVGSACHPNVILESMAAGLAVVASNVGSIPEVIQHGRNGLLVPPGDPAALTQALRILADDPALARRLGLAARRTILEKFTWTHAAQRMRAVYREVQDAHAGPDAPIPSPAKVTA